MISFNRSAHFGFGLSLLMILVLQLTVSAQTVSPNVLINVLKDEQQRAFDLMRRNGNPPPYFLSFQIAEINSTSISASRGALRESTDNRIRNLDINVRVGDFKLDNTNGRGGATTSVRLPVEDDVDALKSAIWLTADAAYKNAVDGFLRLKTLKDTTVADEYPADDFSPVAPQNSLNPRAEITVNKAEWEDRLRRLSAIFKKYPEIYSANVSFSADSVNRYFVNSEGATVRHGKVLVRVSIFAATKADDGMNLFRYEAFDSATVDGLPSEAQIQAAVEKVAQDVVALRRAPVIEPYTGPAILSGRASGVFFHEIFGHRIEGHRQKDNFEGNTFTSQVDQNVLPAFISVTDDPTIDKLGSLDLNGHYRFDEEGVRAAKVPLVVNGVLKNFLMSRSPIVGFPVSNGHGRAAPGFAPVSRQGNLIIEAHRTVPKTQLRQRLIDEVRRQGKKFGLFFDDISGGFTNTTRYSPQAFQVTPVMVYRVYADGRPDELVRGVDLIGTPLTSFSKIIAADDKAEVFNGFCGAESGFIPVSAISPGILISQIEVQKRARSNELLPILPPPPVTAK